MGNYKTFAEQPAVAKMTAIELLERIVKLMEPVEDAEGNETGEYSTRDDFLAVMDVQDLLALKDAVDGMRGDLATEVKDERYAGAFYYGKG